MRSPIDLRPPAVPARGWLVGRRGWLGAVGVAGGLSVLGLWLAVRSRPAPPETTVTLEDLVRVGDRLVWSRDTNHTFTGWLADRHADGTLRSRSWVEDGVLNGLSEGWYPNGVLQVRERFVQGIAEGPRVKWHLNGATQSLATVVRGQIHGRFLRWREDGSLSEDVMMKAGQPDGLSRAFYPSGFVKAEVRLRAGEVLDQQFWRDGERAWVAAGTAEAGALDRAGD